MNDQQLLDMLRAIDRPAAPDRAFADGLYTVLERRTRPRRGPSRAMLLVAALLAAAAVGAAIAVGSQLLKQQPIVVVDTSPAATSRPYTVSIPSNVNPDSTPQEVAARAATLGRVLGMTLIVEGTRYPVDGELTDPLTGAIWEVVVQVQDGRFVTYLFHDEGLGSYTPVPAIPDYPEPTLVPLPSWDPLAPIALVSDHGRTIHPTIVALPEVAPTQRIGPLLDLGDVAWAKVTDVASGDIVQLLRLDARTGSMSLKDLPEHLMGTELHRGIGRLWLESWVTSEIHALDANTGALTRTIQTATYGPFLGETLEGIWFRTAATQDPLALAGAVLVDTIGDKVVRRIATPDQAGAYRGFWAPPMYGSLWDVSEDGVLYRVDAVSGEVEAAIELTFNRPRDSGPCSRPIRLVGSYRGFDQLMTVYCRTGQVAIDASTNSVAFVVPGVDAPMMPNGATLLGQPWALRIRDAGTATWVGTLTRIDPADGSAVETFAFNRPRTAAIEAPIVIDDQVWIVVGERSRSDDPFVQNHMLIRIPLAELTG